MIVLMVIGATGTFGSVYFKGQLRGWLGLPLKHGMSPLHEAAGHNDLPRVQALVAGGAAVNATDKRDVTPLHKAAAAAKDGAPVVVAYLLEHGANVDARDIEGMTPLHLANTSAVAEALLAHGANPHVSSKGHDEDTTGGLTPLHTAAARGKSGVMKLLLKRGIPVNVRDNAGRTPLHHAAEVGTGSAARVLLDAGAEINALDNSGNTPMKLTVRNIVVSDVLRARGAKE